MLSRHVLQHHAHLPAASVQHSISPVQWSRRLQLVTLCKHEKRTSANNYAARKKEERKQRRRGLLIQEPYATATENVVAQRARMLQRGTHGQLAFQLCLFVFTEQPQLLSINTKHLAARVLLLGEVLGLPVPDVAELLVRCPALLDVLPLRLRSTTEALGSALNLTQPQALFMLASDLNLMDTPPLRVRQYLEGLGQLLGAPWELLGQLVWQCPHLLRVEPAALQLRWAGLQAALGISTPAVQQLLAKEPRLLMPDSQTLAQNHAAILTTLNISHNTLSRWVLAAPMLLLVPAQQLQKRLRMLSKLLTQIGQQLVQAAAAGEAAGVAVAADAAVAAAAAAVADEGLPAAAVSADTAAGSKGWSATAAAAAGELTAAGQLTAGVEMSDISDECTEEGEQEEEGSDGEVPAWAPVQQAAEQAAVLLAAAAAAAAPEEGFTPPAAAAAGGEAVKAAAADADAAGPASAVPGADWAQSAAAETAVEDVTRECRHPAEALQADGSSQHHSYAGSSSNGSNGSGGSNGNGSGGSNGNGSGGSNGNGSGGSNGTNAGSSTGSSSSSGDLQWQCMAQDPLQLLAYVGKDPRVLLLSVDELLLKLPQLAGEFTAGPDRLCQELAAWLVLSHPSYMAAEAGVVSNWCFDVTHLTRMTLLQAKRLAVCPQVFLTMAPEDVVAALDTLCNTLNSTLEDQLQLCYTLPQVAAVAAEEPLLLVQHPGMTATAARQLQGLVPAEGVRRQLLDAVPQLLMQGQQLQRVFVSVAGLLAVSCTQLAVMLIKDAGLWASFMPRHTWPTCAKWQQRQQQQQQQQEGQQQQQEGQQQQQWQPSSSVLRSSAAGPGVQLAPAAATAAATMAALVDCGLQAPLAMQTAVVLHPELLRLNPDEALARVKTLQDVCGRCYSWQQQLQAGALTPDQLGKALTRAFSWHSRLTFLVDAGWSRGVLLGKLVQMTLREFHSQFGTQYTWYLEQQAQWRLRQQRAAWLQQQQQQQLEVQLRDGSMTAAAAAPGGEGASKQTLAAAVAAAFASAATSSAAPGAEVYYCAEGETASPSAAYASFSDHDDGSSVHGENMFQQRQQQQLFSPPGQKSAASQQDVHQPGEMQHWRLQQQQGLPPIRWPLQQQLQQQQHSPHQAPHDSSSSRYPHAQLANSMRRAVSRRQAAMAAAQLSGFEMYGTWLGCLVQPVDDVVLLQEQLQQEQ